jgi:hypothetical protein
VADASLAQWLRARLHRISKGSARSQSPLREQHHAAALKATINVNGRGLRTDQKA